MKVFHKWAHVRLRKDLDWKNHPPETFQDEYYISVSEMDKNGMIEIIKVDKTCDSIRIKPHHLELVSDHELISNEQERLSDYLEYNDISDDISVIQQLIDYYNNDEATGQELNCIDIVLGILGLEMIENKSYSIRRIPTKTKGA